MSFYFISVQIEYMIGHFSSIFKSPLGCSTRLCRQTSVWFAAAAGVLQFFSGGHSQQGIVFHSLRALPTFYLTPGLASPIASTLL
jgi:hypothetical protein